MKLKLEKAEILCELENGNIGTYEIEIQKIFLENNENNKSMLIKITDEDLIEKNRWYNTRNERSTDNSKW